MTTKYNVGEEVWIIVNNIPKKSKVLSIYVSELGKIFYTFEETVWDIDGCIGKQAKFKRLEKVVGKDEEELKEIFNNLFSDHFKKTI